MIYVNGDSWSQRTPSVDTPDIWPNLIAKKLNLELVNQSVGCGSNQRILDCLENLYLDNQTPEYIIIGLTTHCRDFISAPEMGHWNISNGFAKLELTGEDSPAIAKWWVTHSYDTVESIFKYYKTLWNIHNLCTKFGCPYFMFQVWDTELAHHNLLGGEVKVANFLEQYYTNTNAWYRTQYTKAFNAITEHSSNWNYIEKPIEMTADTLDAWPDGHPNKEGHALIAEFVYQHI